MHKNNSNPGHFRSLQFYVCETIILYDMCITKFVNPSSAGDFACSAGELEIESESWRLGIYGTKAYAHPTSV